MTEPDIEFDDDGSILEERIPAPPADVSPESPCASTREAMAYWSLAQAATRYEMGLLQPRFYCWYYVQWRRKYGRVSAKKAVRSLKGGSPLH